MNILGISAFYHDSAACLVRDGKIVSAAQEERFSRKKHDWSFPRQAAAWCLKDAGLTAADLDLVVFYDKPFLKFERLLETYLEYAPLGLRSFLKAIPLWIKQKIWIKSLIADELSYKGKILFPEHHASHAASAFFPSPFARAAFLTLDGVGEWTTTSFGVGEANRLRMLGEIRFPHSLGLLYSAFTAYTGFKVNSGEYKVMGLAPYGRPIYKDLILKHLIDLKPDGSFGMDMSYFNYCTGLTMTNRKFHKLFGGPPRKSESKITQRDMDLARSIQEVTEEAVLRIGQHVHRVTGQEDLCMAGGVALNCVANGRLLREGPFKRIWIQPAAGDAGGALGAALFGWYQHLQRERHPNDRADVQSGSLLGPQYSRDAIREFLSERNLPFDELDDSAVIERTAEAIARGQVVGWFQGRMEFGPRALGARSILGDPRSPEMQKRMNIRIKFRESFRPFAPSIKEERAKDYFELDQPSPYMLLVAPVKENRRRQMSEEEEARFGIDKLNVVRSDIPAVTHVDYSARIQTVTPEVHGIFYQLLDALDLRHGVLLVVNTSFNVRGEPIVMTPEDAWRCFMRTDMDVLVMGNFFIEKARQAPVKKDMNWKKEFVLD